MNSLKDTPEGPSRSQKQIGLSQLSRNRIDVDWLQELRSEQFVDPGDLMPGHAVIEVRKEPMTGVVGWIRSDRLIALDEGELLETQVSIDACLARRCARPDPRQFNCDRKTARLSFSSIDRWMS